MRNAKEIKKIRFLFTPLLFLIFFVRRWYVQSSRWLSTYRWHDGYIDWVSHGLWMRVLLIYLNRTHSVLFRVHIYSTNFPPLKIVFATFACKRNISKWNFIRIECKCPNKSDTKRIIKIGSSNWNWKVTEKCRIVNEWCMNTNIEPKIHGR